MAERKSKGAEQERERQRIRKRACDLYHLEGMTIADIVVELNLTRPTIHKYLREAGLTGKRGERKEPPALDVGAANALDNFLDAASKGEVTFKEQDTVTPEDTLYARKEEDNNITLAANENMSAGDRYNAYMAGQGMRMIRDAIPHLKKPTNVRELEVLDGIVRRSLGLGTGKGGNTKLSIDLTILNNSKASPKGAVVDIESD